MWGGWFQERDWKHWQAHMERLIGRMDELLTREGETVALWTGSVCQKVEPGKMAGKKEGEERENPHRSEEESMTFFERELKKLFGTGANFSEPRFVGNCCYGRLTDQIRCHNQHFRPAINFTNISPHPYPQKSTFTSFHHSLI